MPIEVRPCADGELVQGLTPIFHFFGSTPSGEGLELLGRVLAAERVHAAWEDGVAVGGAGAFPFELSVPGGRVRAAGVTVVGVLPTHRRRGVLKQMMRAQLDDVRGRGEPVAYLWASEATIYGRFGYGLASWSASMELLRDRASFRRPVEPRGVIRIVDGDAALDRIPPIYEQVAARTPGMFARSRDWWEARALADPQWRRAGGGEMVRAVFELDGRDAAYALYRVNQKFEHGVTAGSLRVIEAMGVSPAATAGLWRYLLDVDWVERIEAALLPVDHPLLLLLAEPRRTRWTLTDALWVRLVDVGEALRGRSYGDAPPVVVDVADGFCDWNAGRWRIGGGAERTDDEPDLRCDVTALGSVYLGGVTWAQLARVGEVEELSPGAVAGADDLFRTSTAPWCPEIF